MMTPDLLLSLFRAVAVLAPLAATAIKFVTHLSGADRHRTAAGEIAEGLNQAGDAARTFLNGVQHADPVRDPPA